MYQKTAYLGNPGILDTDEVLQISQLIVLLAEQ